jgi:hypothetical protein
MSATPPRDKPAAESHAPAQVASTDSTPEIVKPTPPTQVDLAADDAMAKLTALHLDAYAQTILAATAPTGVDPPAGDEVSALTAARFGAHAQSFKEISLRFAAAHEALMKSLANNADRGAAANPGDATTAS